MSDKLLNATKINLQRILGSSQNDGEVFGFWDARDRRKSCACELMVDWKCKYEQWSRKADDVHFGVEVGCS